MRPDELGRQMNKDTLRILEMAFREALSDGKNYVEPKHLLAALSRTSLDIVAWDDAGVPVVVRLRAPEGS